MQARKENVVLAIEMNNQYKQTLTHSTIDTSKLIMLCNAYLSINVTYD